MSSNEKMDRAGLSTISTQGDSGSTDPFPTFTQEGFELVSLAPRNTTKSPDHDPIDTIDPIAPNFPFLRLPLEIRLDIIEMTVISQWVLHWQGHYHPDKRNAASKAACRYVCNGINTYLPSRYNIAALLITSRAIYLEAAPLFYRKNDFHFWSPTPALPIAFQSSTFTANLRHLTIGPSVPSTLNERRARTTDKTNAVRLREIMLLCPNLVSFTNHVPQVLEPPGLPPGTVPSLFQIIFARPQYRSTSWWIHLSAVTVVVVSLLLTIGFFTANLIMKHNFRDAIET